MCSTLCSGFGPAGLFRSGLNVLPGVFSHMQSNIARPIPINFRPNGVDEHVRGSNGCCVYGARLFRRLVLVFRSATGLSGDFFLSEPLCLAVDLRSWVSLADQRGIEPPPVVSQRQKSAAIPTESRGRLPSAYHARTRPPSPCLPLVLRRTRGGLLEDEAATKGSALHHSEYDAVRSCLNDWHASLL